MITTEENCTAGTCKASPRNEAAPEATPTPQQTSAPGPRGPKWVEVTFRDYNTLTNTPTALRDALQDADVQVILLRLEVARLQHKLEQAEANGQTLANDLGAAQEEKLSAIRDNHSLTAELKAAVQRSEQANLDLHRCLGIAHKEIQSWKSEASHLSNQCGTYLRTITQQKETIADLKFQHAATKAQNVAMSRERQKRFTPHEPRPGTSRVEPFGITSPTPEPQPTEPLGSHNHSVCKGCVNAWRSAAVNPGQNGWCYMFINEPETGHCAQWMPRHDHRKVGV